MQECAGQRKCLNGLFFFPQPFLLKGVHVGAITTFFSQTNQTGVHVHVHDSLNIPSFRLGHPMGSFSYRSLAGGRTCVFRDDVWV